MPKIVLHEEKEIDVFIEKECYSLRCCFCDENPQRDGFFFRRRIMEAETSINKLTEVRSIQLKPESKVAICSDCISQLAVLLKEQNNKN